MRAVSLALYGFEESHESCVQAMSLAFYGSEILGILGILRAGYVSGI